MAADESTEKYLREQRDAARCARDEHARERSRLSVEYAELCARFMFAQQDVRTARIVATVAVIVAVVLAGCALHLRHALTLQGRAQSREVG